MSYEKMKERCKNLIREQSHFTYLLTSLCSMFKWNVPDGVEERYLEMYLHQYGSFGVGRTDDKLIVVPSPSRAGNLNQYGDGLDVYGVSRGNGIQIRGTFGDDIAICYNNITRTPDLDLIRYADGFSNIDKAVYANIQWTILAPILCASNDKTYKLISDMVDDILDGKLKCIVSQDVIASLQGGRNENVYSIDVTHPERIKNVQYQSELYDVLMRRFFNKYGLNIQNTSKHAQATVDEVHGLDSVSWVLPLDMLKERKLFCEAATRIFGGTWDVDFNEPWKTEFEKFNAQSDEEIAESEIAENEAENTEPSEGNNEESEENTDESLGEN